MSTADGALQLQPHTHYHLTLQSHVWYKHLPPWLSWYSADASNISYSPRCHVWHKHHLTWLSWDITDESNISYSPRRHVQHKHLPPWLFWYSEGAHIERFFRRGVLVDGCLIMTLQPRTVLHQSILLPLPSRALNKFHLVKCSRIISTEVNGGVSLR